MKNKENTLILVTNDDGYRAKGFQSLLEAMRPFGKVIGVAPHEGQSGMASAITMRKTVGYQKIREETDFELYACTGTPVDCVKLARAEILPRKPDFLVSGINHGSNSSINVLYSGTIGAVLEGCLNRIPSLGFSLKNYDPDADFETSGKYAAQIFRKIAQNGLPRGTGLNVNFPPCGENEIAGIKICHQTAGVWREKYYENQDPYGGKHFWLTGEFENHEPQNENSDEWALANNYIAIVPVRPDFTDFENLSKLKNLEL